MNHTPSPSGVLHAGQHRSSESPYSEATDGKVAPGEIAVGVIIGRASEYFDFFVYALASVLVFPALVFPFADPVTATLYSFALFALAFAARPFGTLLFIAIDWRYGRGVKLTPNSRPAV